MSALQELSIDLNAEIASAQGGRTDKAASGGVSGWVASLPIGKKIIVFFSGNLLVALAAAVVMGLIVWAIRRQLDPMVLDRKREKEAKARRHAQRR